MQAPAGLSRLAVALSIAVLCTLQGPVAAQDPGPVRTVPSVELDRYLGEWYEIARLPNRFQHNCARDVRATYTRREDGRIDVVNRCLAKDGELIESRGVARVVDRQTSSKLEVRFAPSFLSFVPGVWGDYWILGLADDYSWAVVGTPDRKYLWILSRSEDMPAEAWDAAVDAAKANGFDVDRLIKSNPSKP